MQAPEVRHCWNIRLGGALKFIPENNTMWAVLTTASTTPTLEMDFIGPDGFEILGHTDEKVAAMQAGNPTETP